jgi:GTP-binding protein
MTAVVAIVGRPNVGKSTLFNRLTGTRDALVADLPGLTRDPIWGRVAGPPREFLLIDTGGLGSDDPLTDRVSQQSIKSAQDADLILLLGEASGLTAEDQAIARQLRALGPPVLVVVNKSEGRGAAEAAADWHALGLGEPLAVSALRNQGIQSLREAIAAKLPPPVVETVAAATEPCIAISVIGRPNVGKSTLVNRMLGEQRMLASELPGTTRDSVSIEFKRFGICFRLVDTPGVRRRARVDEGVEKLSVIKSLQSIERSDVVIMVVDATEGITDQDTTLLGIALDSGRSLLISINKWDGLSADQRRKTNADCDRKLRFVEFAPLHFISALHGSGVGKLLEQAKQIWDSTISLPRSAQLTSMLEQAVTAHPPPMVRGRRIKLRYAHLGGTRPVRIVVHGTQVSSVPGSYRRYLENFFRAELGLIGTPVRVGFKQSENPFEGLRNKLTLRQRSRRRRLMRHVKKGR